MKPFGKKLTGAMLVFAMTAGLAGCGSSSDTGSVTTEAVVEKAEAETEAAETEETTKTAAAETAEQEADMVCPRCGAALILRTAKKGANAGNQFYGCTAFPKCRYIRNINDNTSK